MPSGEVTIMEQQPPFVQSANTSLILPRPQAGMLRFMAQIFDYYTRLFPNLLVP